MFDIYSWIILGVFIGAIIFALIIGKIKNKINKKYFSKEKLKEYEKSLEVYKLSINDSIDDVAKKFKKTIKFIGMKKEGHISDHNSYIEISNKLSKEKRNFAIAHELGHNIRGFKSEANRNKKTIINKFSPEEQICDYYAAAILLPIKDMEKLLKENNYLYLDKKDKEVFIEKLAKMKQISPEVAYRRINEVSYLTTN